MPPPHSISVFFTNVPLFVEAHSLRKHFESVGHITDFRFLGPAHGRDFRYGFADYLDPASAAEAIARLNGISFGERAMKVTSAANARGRKRHRHQNQNQQNYYYNNHNNNHNNQQQQSRIPGGMTFPRGYADPLLGREDNSVLECLQSTTIADAYEAVEQLRVLVLERKTEARKLLESFPALRLAVVMILQHAGRIPFGPLPPEAIQNTGSIVTGGQRVQSSLTSTNNNLASAEEDEVLRRHTLGQHQEREEQQQEDNNDREMLEILTNLSEEDLERILTMSDDDFNRIPDSAQRQQMLLLQSRLLEMKNNLD